MTDMAGNVLEWTGSDFDATKKVVRGGGWNEPNKTQLTTFYRIGYPPDYRNDTIGFRCAMSAP
jgi:formylglycine-generating enzyme required for sulfatase activity